MAGAIVGLLLLAAYILPEQSPSKASAAYTPATVGPLGSAFVLLAIILTAGSEWAAEEFIEGERFPIAEKMFGLLPWLYSLVLAIAVVAFAFWIKEGFSPGRENVFIFAFFFLWFCPHEFRWLRVTAGLGTAVMCFTIWWTTPHAPYLVLAMLGIGASLTKPDFGIMRSVVAARPLFSRVAFSR